MSIANAEIYPRFIHINMTICIAAIGKCNELKKDEEALVIATDRMISLHEVGQFEHSIEKYRTINDNTIAMLSGEALLFNSILSGIGKKDKFEKIVDKINKNMTRIRDERIQKLVFDKFQIDFDYLKEVLMKPEYNNTIEEIVNLIKQFSLQTTILLVGYDNKEAQIYEINENDAANTRDINFDAIGSGAVQAINTLLFQRHSKTEDLKTTIYNVYKAKKNSEVSVGVGKETDIFVVLEEGRIIEFTEKQLKIMDNIYYEELKFGKKHNKLTRMMDLLGE